MILEMVLDKIVKRHSLLARQVYNLELLVKAILETPVMRNQPISIPAQVPLKLGKLPDKIGERVREYNKPGKLDELGVRIKENGQ